jgi:hypothetical protein
MEGALGIQVSEALIRHHRTRQRCPSPQISSKLVYVKADKNLANLGAGKNQAITIAHNRTCTGALRNGFNPVTFPRR